MVYSVISFLNIRAAYNNFKQELQVGKIELFHNETSEERYIGRWEVVSYSLLNYVSTQVVFDIFTVPFKFRILQKLVYDVYDQFTDIRKEFLLQRSLFPFWSPLD